VKILREALAFGDNNDGMVLFVSGSRSVLSVNNEGAYPLE